MHDTAGNWMLIVMSGADMEVWLTKTISIFSRPLPPLKTLSNIAYMSGLNAINVSLSSDLMFWIKSRHLNPDNSIFFHKSSGLRK